MIWSLILDHYLKNNLWSWSLTPLILIFDIDHFTSDLAHLWTDHLQFRADGSTYFTWINTTSGGEYQSCWCRNDKSGNPVSRPGFVFGMAADCAATCPIEYDIDYFGHDVGSLNQPDWQSCQSFCMSNFPSAPFFAFAPSPVSNCFEKDTSR